MRCRLILLEPVKGNIISEEIPKIVGEVGIDYSHCAIEVEGDQIVEAEMMGVQETPRIVWERKNADRKKIYSDYFESAINPFDEVGTPYDYASYVNWLGNFAFKKIYPKLALWFINRESKTTIQCFQLGAKIYGVKNYSVATPQLLLQLPIFDYLKVA